MAENQKFTKLLIKGKGGKKYLEGWRAGWLAGAYFKQNVEARGLHPQPCGCGVCPHVNFMIHVLEEWEKEEAESGCP